LQFKSGCVAVGVWFVTVRLNFHNVLHETYPNESHHTQDFMSTKGANENIRIQKLSSFISFNEELYRYFHPSR